MPVAAVQVGNMNYLAGRRCSAWKAAVSTARMDEERQERDETDSSSQPSSIHPHTHIHPPTSPPPPPYLLNLFSRPPSTKILGLYPCESWNRKGLSCRSRHFPNEKKERRGSFVCLFFGLFVCFVEAIKTLNLMHKNQESKLNMKIIVPFMNK